MLYILLGLIGLTLAVLLILGDDNGQVFGLDGNTIAMITSSAAILLFVSGGVFNRGMTLSKGVQMAVVWLLIGTVLFVGYRWFNA